jgi:hypothetical protein
MGWMGTRMGAAPPSGLSVTTGPSDVAHMVQGLLVIRDSE